MKHGPNVNKLIAHKMAVLMVPAGGGIAAGIAALAKPGNIAAVAKESTAWVEQALAVVKTAPDNPYGQDDEAIAAEILRRIEEKSKVARSVKRT